MQSRKILNDLPATSDLEFWNGAEVYRHTAKPIEICETHTGKNWMSHSGYVDNRDGTITCKWCPWGTRMAGHLRVINGRVINLMDLTRE